MQTGTYFIVYRGKNGKDNTAKAHAVSVVVSKGKDGKTYTNCGWERVRVYGKNYIATQRKDGKIDFYPEKDVNLAQAYAVTVNGKNGSFVTYVLEKDVKEKHRVGN